MKPIVTITIALVITFSAFSQTENDYFFDNYDTRNGLIHSYVLSIFQDSRGLIWVGTYGGVQAYNGYEFNQFNIVGKKEKYNLLTNNVVHCIFEDNEHNLWFGTERGINIYNPRSGNILTYYSEPGEKKHLSSNNIRSIVQDSSKNIWIGTFGGGLMKYHAVSKTFDRVFSKEKTPEASIPERINTLYLDENQLLWIGAENDGAIAINTQTLENKVNIKRIDNENYTVNCFFIDNKQNAWIGTWNHGLVQYNLSTRTSKRFFHQASKNSLSGNNIKCIIPKDQETLWVATYGNGLNILNLNNYEFQRVRIQSGDPDSNAEDFIWTAFIDKNYSCWFGSFGKGLYKLNTFRNTFKSHKISINNEQKANISAVTQDKSGSLLLSTFNQGIIKFNPYNQHISTFNLNAGIDNHIYTLHNDANNTLWIGTTTGLYVIENNSNIRGFQYSAANPNGISKNIVNNIYIDKNENIWIGYWEAELNMIKKGELNKRNNKEVIFTKYSHLVKTGKPKVRSNVLGLSGDAEGNILIGTTEYLVVFNPNNRTEKIINIPMASVFKEDKFGNIWVGTNGLGLYKLNKLKEITKKYSYNEGLNCADILAIETDSRNRIWMSTSCGLSTLDPNSDLISNFEENYGIKKYHYNPKVSITTNNGTIIFGGKDGISLFDASNIYKESSVSPIYISDVKLNNKSIAYENSDDSLSSYKGLLAELDTLEINSQANILTIKFAAINYKAASDILYSYILEGYDLNWIESDMSNRTATYSNLKPGKYLFKIRTTYFKGIWNNTAKTLVVIVKPKLWQRLWFKAMIAVLFLGFFSIIFWLLFIRKRLIIILRQKHSLFEELRKEKELLNIKNDELKEEIEKYNRTVQSISNKYKALKNHVNTLYQNIIDSISNLKVAPNQQLTQVAKMLEEDIVRLDALSFEDSTLIKNDDFITRFAKQYPQLNSNDLRICTLIRKNKTNKDIAQFLNITQASLEQSRYRMRKKMQLSPDINLNELILRF